LYPCVIQEETLEGEETYSYQVEIQKEGRREPYRDGEEAE